ncbi:MAG: N-acetylneuraminate synthase family protein [Pseudomonadota bacterium]|nr:N-acetylneuraminate synthase family protein [Pseudomonadota bacterium]
MNDAVAMTGKFSVESTEILRAWTEKAERQIFVIAEIGINHNGDIDLAKQMIDLAAEVGSDAVKFQKRTLDVVYTREFLDSPRESPFGDTQRAQKEGLEFGESEYDIIDSYCHEKGIEWFASAWDIESQHFLRKYDLTYNKIASATLTHVQLLNEVAAERKLTFISTGMADYTDISRAVEIFYEHDCPFVLMHCVSTYPTPEEDLNLRMIGTLRERYGCPVGYSGHEVSVSPSVIAAMQGALAIERHFTLNRAMYGSDQPASLETEAFRRLVKILHKIPVVLGDGIKRFDAEEKAVAGKLRYWESSD